MTVLERVAAAQSVPGGFGQGWMSSAARDMVRIAAFAGFDTAELVRRVAMTSNPERTTNAASVGRVMDEMLAEWDAAHSLEPQ